MARTVSGNSSGRRWWRAAATCLSCSLRRPISRSIAPTVPGSASTENSSSSSSSKGRPAARSTAASASGRTSSRICFRRRPRLRIEAAVQALGGQDVRLAEGLGRARAAVEPLVAEGREADPAALAGVGGAEEEGTASARVPEDGGSRGVERDRVGAGARQDQVVAHRPPLVRSILPVRTGEIPGRRGIARCSGVTTLRAMEVEAVGSAVPSPRAPIQPVGVTAELADDPGEAARIRAVRALAGRAGGDRAAAVRAEDAAARGDAGGLREARLGLAAARARASPGL